MLKLSTLQYRADVPPPIKATGQVIAVKGPIIFARVPAASLGDICIISSRNSSIHAQVVSFENDTIALAPYSPIEGVAPGAKVTTTGCGPKVFIFESPLGKVLDAEGNLLSKESTAPPSRQGCLAIPIFSPPPAPLSRTKIKLPINTGVKAIDGLCPVGYGQRMGLFAGAGVGKSTLLGMIARNADVDVTVIALVGERGREVNEFLEDCLGEEGRRKSVVVVATSDETPLRRMIAPFTATAIAEYFRDNGLRVLLLVDSLTRTARAIREVGLSAGELPVRQGYTSSVFTELPRLLERTGANHLGSITAFYTVLINGDGEVDPLGEEVKSILDGHIYLTNESVQRGIRPGIDPTISISRLLGSLRTESEIQNISIVIKLLSRLKRDRDILLLGGTPDRELKVALELEEQIKQLLSQKPNENVSSDCTLMEVRKIAQDSDGLSR